MCNVTGVAYDDDPTGNYHPTLRFPFICTELFSLFKHIVLVFQDPNSTVITLVSNRSRQLLSVKMLHCTKLQTQLVKVNMSLRCWWRLKQR